MLHKFYSINVFELVENKLFTFLTWGIIIGGIVYGIKKYRDGVLKGFISYGSALGYGVLISLFASIISSFAPRQAHVLIIAAVF